MFSITTLCRTALATAAATVTLCGVLSAQTNHDEQAKTILRLYETGQKDSAYALIEPLKRSARFVPSVLYTRAQMTPDDRALNLYKEIIALNPTGEWADDAAYQLVRRYADKRDSSGAYTWAAMLKNNFPKSQYLANTDQMLKGITGWQQGEGEEMLVADKHDTKPTTHGHKAATKDTKAKPATTTATESTVKPAKPATDTHATSMRGYALQLGVFPTKAAADARSAELKKKSITASSFPKMVDGKKQFALVVGPYKTLDAANKKKGTLATSCDCETFVVKVE